MRGVARAADHDVYHSIALSVRSRHLVLNEHLRLSLHQLSCYEDPLVLLADRRQFGGQVRLCCYLKQHVARVAKSEPPLRFQLPDPSDESDAATGASVLRDLPHGGRMRLHSWRGNNTLMLFMSYVEAEERVGVSLVLQFLELAVLC